MPLTRRAFGLSLAALALSPTPSFAQFDNQAYDDAEIAVLSAGTAARRVAALRHVAGISAYNMGFKTTPMRFDFDRTAQSLGITADRHAGEVASLRAALRRNPATAHALAAHGIAIARVIGIHISSGGWLTVYFL